MFPISLVLIPFGLGFLCPLMARQSFSGKFSRQRTGTSTLDYASDSITEKHFTSMFFSERDFVFPSLSFPIFLCTYDILSFLFLCSIWSLFPYPLCVRLFCFDARAGASHQVPEVLANTPLFFLQSLFYKLSILRFFYQHASHASVHRLFNNATDIVWQ